MFQTLSELLISIQHKEHQNMSSNERSLGLNAEKSYDGDDGLVCVSGWKKHAGGKTILVTVKDESSLKNWIRFIDCKASTKSTIRMKIAKSSVHQKLAVTAEPLEEWQDPVHQGTTRWFTVRSTISCTAFEKRESREEIFSYLINCLSINNDLHDFSKLMTLELDRKSCESVSLRITRRTPLVRKWLITVIQTDVPQPKFVFLVPVDGNTMDFHLPVVFRAGASYSVDVEGLDFTGGIIVCQSRTDFRAVFTVEEIQLLRQMAIGHVGSKSALCKVFYRNKAPEYFDNILRSRGGIMETYEKDDSGDPGSPINGHLNGLFFMASVNPGSKKGVPNVCSAFGHQRILVPAEQLLAKARNLYFVDFYCMRGTYHYVTLVMTNPGSEADRFCSAHLIPLDVRDRSENPFLFYDDAGKLQVCAKKSLHVELYFTEDLDIRGWKTCRTPIVGKGSSTDGGIPKNPECTKCNLKRQQYSPSGSPMMFPFSF